MTAANVINVHQLAKEFKLQPSVVYDLFERKSLKPVYQMAYGNGIMKMFDREAAFKVMREYILEREKPKEPPAPAPKESGPATHLVDITVLEAKIKVLSEAIEDLLETQQAIREQNELLKKQNQELFRWLHMQKDFQVKLAECFGFSIEVPA